MNLTTTSYAILGLLALRDWSAYELAQQTDRSLAFVWPVSETQLYAEPKRLAREGLITITQAPAGPRRHRQVFSITEAGRRALREWLATQPAPPRLQMEVLLRCLLATLGTKQNLLAALAATRQATAAAYHQCLAMVHALQAGDNPFPERLHANILWMVLVRDLYRLIFEWIDFATTEVEQWTDPLSGGDATRVAQLLGSFPDLPMR